MKKLTMLVLALGLASTAYARNDKKEKAPAAAGDKAAKPAATEKLTGEVIDVNCFADHGAKGEKHAACAQKCLQGGSPAGILADGKLWIATTSDHSAPSTKLASFAGKMVTVTGKKIEKDGANLFEIDTVEPAAAGAAK